MNIAMNLLKTSAIIGGAYALMDLSFQIGKGYMLYMMKKYNATATADELLSIIKAYAPEAPFVQKVNLKIIEFIAKQDL